MKQTKKISDWISENKFPIMVGLFIITVIILLVILKQSFEKDHSLDKVKLELKLKEENRLEIEQVRAVYDEVIRGKDEFIRTELLKDSILKATGLQLDSKYNKLSNQYNEKSKAINSYGSDELRDQFNSLPVGPDNDF